MERRIDFRRNVFGGERAGAFISLFGPGNVTSIKLTNERLNAIIRAVNEFHKRRAEETALTYELPSQ